MRILQEFFCGECEKYIRILLHMHYDRVVNIVCPNCQHQHRRYIANGKIQEDGRYNNGDVKEDIIPMKSAVFDEPASAVMIAAKKKTGRLSHRDAEIIQDFDFHMADRWLEKAGNEMYGDANG